jgi:hypothetical protein
MSDVYELRTITDLLKVPHDRLAACLRDIQYALELCHFTGGEHTAELAVDTFVWTDDGQHDIEMSLNGEPFITLAVTDTHPTAAGEKAE